MDNNAFKDLVRSRTNSAPSSKAIARKAVEEEFRKKKKRKRGGGYASSSDEEEDSEDRKRKGRHETNNPSDKDDAEAVQKDLSSRYRDRAKERREGKLPPNNNKGNDDSGETSTNNFLIIPQNIKGLDLALARQERRELQVKSGRGKSAADPTESDDSRAQQPRKEMPTMEEATQILKDFVSTAKESSGDHDMSTSMVEYLDELIQWKTLDITSWDGETNSSSAAGRSLQRTEYAMAIDGHPSDSIRAWEIPRQYTLSSFMRGSDSSGPLLSSTLRNRIDAIFRYRNRIREAILLENQAAISKKEIKRKVATEESQTIEPVSKNNNNPGATDEESDDDMFGGLDD